MNKYQAIAHGIPVKQEKVLNDPVKSKVKKQRNEDFFIQQNGYEEVNQNLVMNFNQ